VPISGGESRLLSREGTREEERFLAPPVDIYETQNDLFVVADMPGVQKDDLQINLEGDLLSIRGMAKHIPTGDTVLSEYSLMNFFREFQISEEIDKEKISADLKNGVLKIRLAKAEAVRPRQIPIH
ncbi:MAG: Hsp20/alpha crystallin family protein, partial [Pseudomonadota bacterium]